MAERISLSVPDLRGREAEYLCKCVADNWVSSAGPMIGQFESRIAALCGRTHAVATINGTAALHLSLAAAGIGPGDLVIVPDWTFAATANAVAHAGATPILVDIDPKSWTLDPAQTGEALDRWKDKVKAVIAVHVLGHPADMDAISTVCRDRVLVLEDAAGAIGASYRTRPAGALGDVATFSFNGNKTVTAGGGGLVVSDDGALAARARHLSQQARTGESYDHDTIGFNYRMTNLCAALGMAQFERLDEMVAAKRGIAARYDAALANRTDLSPMPRLEWAQSSCWLYSVMTASAADAVTLVAHFAAHDIEARVFWRALSMQTPWHNVPQQLTGAARNLSGRVVSLPCSSSLSEQDQDRVLASLAGWRGQPCKEAA